MGLLWDLEVSLGILNNTDEAIRYASLELREEVWDGDIGLWVSGLKMDFKICVYMRPFTRRVYSNKIQKSSWLTIRETYNCIGMGDVDLGFCVGSRN